MLEQLLTVILLFLACLNKKNVKKKNPKRFLRIFRVFYLEKAPLRYCQLMNEEDERRRLTQDPLCLSHLWP